MKARRNKTIDISIQDGEEYLKKCRIDTASLVDEVLHGNCLELMDSLPRAFADLIIADPPYNLSKNYSGSRFHRKKDDEYLAYTRTWLDKVIPLLKPTGTLYVCCDWPSSLIIGQELQNRLNIRNRITWQREKGRGSSNNWKNSMEDIWYCTVSDDFTFNLDAVKERKRVLAPYRENGQAKDWEETSDGRFRDTCPSNFWDDISVPYWSMPENTAHPTQKPEKLLAKLILASSDPGDMVFDPFLGSGSTAVTAKKLGRHYLGIEKEAQYCIWAQKRLEMAETDQRIQGYTGGVFWQRNTTKEQSKV